MSYYYTYYIARQDPKSGMIYPLGPYNKKGKLLPAYEVSRSFASNLHNDFYYIKENLISGELRKEFEYDGLTTHEKVFDAKMLMYSELPSSNYLKLNYYLVSDVKEYIESDDRYTGELFYDHMSPAIYAEKMRNEMIFGKPEPEQDCEGYEIPIYSCADYMLFAYPDYESREWEVAKIKEIANMVQGYNIEDKDLVIILQEG